MRTHFLKSQSLACMLLLQAAALFSWPVIAQPEDLQDIDEIVVVGRQPGPPLWRVTNGENTLWIFGKLSPIPKNMDWDSSRVERVIESSQEYLREPQTRYSLGLGSLLNPVKITRLILMANSLGKNPGGETLDEIMSEDMYRRFRRIATVYTSKPDKLDKLQPLFAMGEVRNDLFSELDLTPSTQQVTRTIDRLVRRNKEMTVTDNVNSISIDGKFKDIRDQITDMVDSLTLEQQLKCVEDLLYRIETELGGIVRRANTWASGYMDELVDVYMITFDDNCLELFTENDNPDIKQIVEQREAMNLQWLDAAEAALATNLSTFALLDIDDLLNPTGLLNRLEERGYEVRRPYITND